MLIEIKSILAVFLMREYEAEHGHDIFFIEENEMIEII